MKMKRTASSNSEAQSYNESPHSPLRFHSPLSDAGDLPESRYVSPEGSPFKIENPKSIVAGNKLTQFSPLPSPIPPPPPQFPPPRRQRNARVPMNSSSDKSPSSMVVHNSWVREDGGQTTTRKAGAPINGEESTRTTVNRARGDDLVSLTALGFRITEVILCVISFSIMAADKTQGWSGDSYDRYKEYRFEACDAACYIAKESYMINCGFHDLFVFSMDQVSAATRVDDWVSNWGKDEFTQMATASIAVSFLAFGAFAVSALISSYRLFTHASS
ncbi:unnamed protein product [Arabidopsis thaliana]|nr:unnamed protein product [Arabidopsis thaliana]